jgi:hypothetical protein
MVLLPDSKVLRGMAYEMLDGFGDKTLGEWVEDRTRAFHLRRRLSPDEQSRIGEAHDCRGTEEAAKRFDAVSAELPPEALFLALEELRIV